MAYLVSAKWAQTLGDGNILWAAPTATVLSDGEPVAGYQQIPLETLQVQASRTSAQRYTVTATVDWARGANLVPADLNGVIAPNGNEMAFQVGLRYTDGTTEYVPVGVFPIVTAVLNDTGDSMPMTVTLADRSWSISRRTLKTPYSITSAETLDVALTDLVGLASAHMPPFQTNISPTTIPASDGTYNVGQDPWQAALDQMDANGWEGSFDRSGNLFAYPTPDPATQPVAWTYTENQGAGLPFYGLQRTLTAQQVVNDVIVGGTDTSGNPIQAEASDTTPTSPTYVNGPFGDVTQLVTSSAATTTAALQAAAQLQLDTSLGQADTVALTVIPNPAIDIDDIVSLTRARAGLVNAFYVVDGWNWTRGPGGLMTVNLRRVVS